MDKPITGRMDYTCVQEAIKSSDIIIKPYDDQSLQSSSLDVTFSNKFLIKKPWVLEISSVEDQKKNYIPITLPSNTEESLQKDKLYNGKGLLWSVRRWLFSLKRGFLAGIDGHGYYVRMLPFGFVLGSLSEYIELNECIEASLDGNTTLARQGLPLHKTAAGTGIGYCGNMTTETTNAMLCFVRLYPNSCVGQLRFYRFKNKCQKPYGIENNHQGHTEVQASKGLKIKRK